MKCLRRNGYSCKNQANFATGKNPYIMVSGNGVFGWIYEGRIIMDNAKCFNKLSQCPLCVTIPLPQDVHRLLRHLKWLATDTAYEWSNDFGYIDNPILPCEHWNS